MTNYGGEIIGFESLAYTTGTAGTVVISTSTAPANDASLALFIKAPAARYPEFVSRSGSAITITIRKLSPRTESAVTQILTSSGGTSLTYVPSSTSHRFVANAKGNIDASSTPKILGLWDSVAGTLDSLTLGGDDISSQYGFSLLYKGTPTSTASRTIGISYGGTLNNSNIVLTEYAPSLNETNLPVATSESGTVVVIYAT
jgi:hypothetical protein